MNNSKRKPGAPKRYADRVMISHAIEADLLTEINRMADYNNTRTSIINDAIKFYLKLKTK